MGSVISTIVLMMGAIIVGVLSSMTANYSRKASWSSAEKFAIISSVVAALMAIIAMIILIVSKQRGGGSMGMSMMASFIFLIIATLAAAGMNAVAIFAAKKQDKSRAEGLSAGAAALMFFAFIVSIVMFFL